LRFRSFNFAPAIELAAAQVPQNALLSEKHEVIPRGSLRFTVIAGRGGLAVRSWERWQHFARAPRTAWDLTMRGRHSFVFDYMPMAVRGMSLRQRLNTLRAGLNLVHRRLSPWAWPLNTKFELASHCNLRCPVCPVGTGEMARPAQFMDVDLFERVMAEVGPYLLMGPYGPGASRCCIPN